MTSEEATLKEADEPSGPSEAELARALRLRAAPPKVTRVSARALATLAGVSIIALGGAVILGLRAQPAKAPPKELYAVGGKPSSEGLAALPSSYGGLAGTNPAATGSEVPKLGPPMPGDLGRPMLKAGVTPPPIGGEAETTGARPAEPPRQQGPSEQDAARSSRLFSADHTESANLSGAAASAPQPVDLAALAGLAAAHPGVAGVQPAASEADRKLAFLNQGDKRAAVSPESLQAAASPYVLQAGGVISAALVTGLRSDLPGEVIAQVTADVYDSPSGRYLLIPQGSKLIGQYDAQVAFGQIRALLAWTRLILPDGRWIDLGREPGADPQGYAGLSGRVDNHWSQLFKAAALSTVLSIGAEAGTSSNQNDLAQAIGQGASDSISQVGRRVVGRSLAIQPTITIRPGFPVRVLVTRDLALEPWPMEQSR
ncbi:TrbI/VirB10 family protein [Phenylobacterium montanum]|uniref:TrbI/VirB10 family protein n=1 Tax=Phenylobacterium montanum TaxID=2823693 RepID=A0A975G3S8_9CAUL|nr:TrbI/VirB10 family protein [Caulobacter sp. S6]QUD90141.1 TrbI/VirB10 family protein [Caulobacter sp. S6]